jgi:hypothetical protein
MSLVENRNKTNGISEREQINNSNYYETLLKKLNSRNITEQGITILNEHKKLYNANDISDYDYETEEDLKNQTSEIPRVRIILNQPASFLASLGIQFNPLENEEENIETADDPLSDYLPSFLWVVRDFAL